MSACEEGFQTDSTKLKRHSDVSPPPSEDKVLCFLQLIPEHLCIADQIADVGGKGCDGRQWILGMT